MKRKSNGKIFIVVIITAMILVVFMTWIRTRSSNNNKSISAKENTPSETAIPSFTPVTTENMVGEAIITLKEDPVTVKVGDKYDANENILSVTDPDGKAYEKVTGEIDYSNPSLPKLPHIDDEQYYVLNADVDTSKPGTKSIDVIAIDKYTQYTVTSFTVNIVE